MTPTHKLVALVFTVALLFGAALAIVGSRGGSEAADPTAGNASSSSDGGRQAAQAQQDEIWKRGTEWTVTIRQDGSPITASGQAGVYEVPYRFRVEKAPADADGEWVVSAKMDGAEGPWADGYLLMYAADERGGFTLQRVSLGGEQAKPVAAKHARAIVGDAFPLERRITKAPKSRSVKEAVSSGTAGEQAPPPPPPM